MAFPHDGKKFVPGETGNPHGRPKKLPALEELIETVLGDEKDGKTAAEAILMALRAKATKGDTKAAEILMDRAWGKAKQSIEHSGTMQPPVINVYLNENNKNLPGAGGQRMADDEANKPA